MNQRGSPRGRARETEGHPHQNHAQLGTRIAVAGASSNPEKYGNKIVRNLLGKGYTVLPLNPREETIEGLKQDLLDHLRACALPPLNYGGHPYHHMGMPGTVIVRE